MAQPPSVAQPGQQAQDPNARQVLGYNYVQASTVRKMAAFLVSTLLIVQSVFKIISLGTDGDSFRAFITGFYFSVLAIIIALVEMEWKTMCQWFVFLNFGLGKAFLFLFMASTMVSFEKTHFMDIIIAVVFCVLIFFNLFLHFKFREEEDERVKNIIMMIKAEREKDM